MKKAIAIIAVLALIFASAIPASAAEVATVFADFEDGTGAVVQVWLGHVQTKYEWVNELTDPLVGDSSLKINVNELLTTSYDGFALPLDYKPAVSGNRDGIVCRFKLTLPANAPDNSALLICDGVSSAGGTGNLGDGYKITDNDGNVIYSENYGNATDTDRFFLNESVDGWLFLTFKSTDKNATTYLSNAGNELDSMQFIMTGFPEGSVITADQFAFYSGTDYAAVIDVLDPTASAPTDDGNDDVTGDVSMVYFALAAVGSASAMFLLRKKK